MASKIKVDQIEGSTASTITIPTGQTFTVTDGIPVASGGTGLASFTAGDILYATGATTLTKLGKGTAEQVLAMNTGATAPDWGSVDLTVLPTITVAKGGTNLSSFTAGDILYATGATTLAKLAKGTAAQTLKMNAGATAPEWATVAAAAGGMHTLVSTTTITTDTAEFDGDQLLTSAYNNWVIDIFNMCPTNSDNQDLIMYMTSGSAGSETKFTGNIQYGRAHSHGSGGWLTDNQDSSGGHIRFHRSGVTGNNDNHGGYLRAQLWNVHNKAPSTTTSVGFLMFQLNPVGRTAASTYGMGGHTWGFCGTETNFTGFRLVFGAGIRGANRPMINCYGVNNVN